MRQATLRGGNRRLGAALIGLVLLCALLFVAPRVGEAQTAESDGCAPVCVVLIQVDGLEPKDVTESSTPYLWRLAHPQLEGTTVPGSALDNRSGWIWQAPRGVVSTGPASATASLLTGGYPEKTGVPANEFYGPSADSPKGMVHQRLTAGGFGDAPHEEAPDRAEPVSAPAADTILGQARDVTDVAVFLGDPGLADVTEANTQGNPYWFPPGTEDTGSARFPEGQFTGNPQLCPIPRYPDGGVQPGDEPHEENFNPSHCPANDLTTVNKAMSDLRQPTSTGVGMVFMHLAELGAVKRLAADTDFEGTLPDLTGDGEGEPVLSPTQALSNMDQAIATFVEQYAQNNAAKWQKTVLMVTGTHGYQTTPLVKRVPNPDAPEDPRQDLSDYVETFGAGGGSDGPLRLVPQGTMATVYYGLEGDGEPVFRVDTLAALKADLERRIDEACESRAPTPDESGCLEGIYYVDPALGEPSERLAENFTTWRLDARQLDSPHARTGASGDLVILLKRGWAFGRGAGVTRTAFEGEPITNANSASSGGPQERAVAALINGPASASSPAGVRNLDTHAGSQLGPNAVKYYPVSNKKVDYSDPNNPPPVDDPACPETTTDPGGLACANDPAEVGNDADDEGHEAQPETVDFAFTISALLQLPFDAHPDQLQGRVLQEAFINELKRPGLEEEPPVPPQCTDVAELTTGQPVTVTMNCRDDANAPLTYRILSPPAHGTLGPVVRDTVTYTPRPGFTGVDSFTYEASNGTVTSDPATAFVTVAEPPVVVRQEGFNFHGLIQKLKAVVVDSRDRTYARARRGSLLSTIRLEGDFGKPESAVTLTFYRRSVTTNRSRRGRRSRVVRLKAIARFDPFVVKRGHVKMRLKVPALFKPHYVGLTVREIARTASGARVRKGAQACTTLRTRKSVPFRCTGPSRGVITRIADAHRLHKRKPGRRAVPRKRR